MEKYELPKPLDEDELKAMSEEEREEARETWNKKLMEYQIYKYNTSIGNLGKLDGINCDYCRNRGWIEVLEAVPRGKKMYYARAMKKCSCRRYPKK